MSQREDDTETPDLLGDLEASLVPKPDRWSKMIADWQRRCDEAEARTRAAEARLAQITETGSVEIHVDCEGCTENTATERALVEALERLAQIAERLLYIACDQYQAAYGPQNGIVRVLHEFGVIDDATRDRHLQPGPPGEREDDRAAVRSAAMAALRLAGGELA